VNAPRQPTPEVITATANPAIALVRALGRRDRRAAEGAFIVEGVRAVRDALETGAMPRFVLIRHEGAGNALPPGLSLPEGVQARQVDARLFDRLSDVQSPQGVMAVFPFPHVPPAPRDPAPLVLVLDQLRDPGNLGTLLRAAAGAGVSAVYLSPQTVDPWNAKAVRAGMGAHFRVPLLPFDGETMANLAQRVPERVIARAGAQLTYDRFDWTAPAALVIGGESEGASPEVVAWASHEVSIPLAAGVESLNAAVAGAVILYEAARQRRDVPHAGEE
jgi:TrmH family RNA methyltransferase